MTYKPLVIANWKLALDHEQSIILANKIANDQSELSAYASIILCPSALSLDATRSALGEDTPVKLGLQNVYSEESGAFTGETSVCAATQLRVEYVIVGHSERRKYFHETDEDVHKKMMLVIAHGLTPIVCIGERYEERQAQQAEVVVTRQLEAAFQDFTPHTDQQIIIAYEPVWAIGTGQAIHPDQAKMMGMVIHQKLVDLFTDEEIKNIRVVYGGSVDASNVLDFIDDRVLSGVLVGGASQKFPEFQALVKALGKR